MQHIIMNLKYEIKECAQMDNDTYTFLERDCSGVHWNHVSNE